MSSSEGNGGTASAGGVASGAPAMSGRWMEVRREVARVAREMDARGLVTGASGNVSVRVPQADGTALLAVTPSGKPYPGMTEDDITVVDFEVEPVEGELVPSSETLMHVEIYRRRPEVQAIVHTHSIYCSVAAVAGLEIPPLIDEMVIRIGGPVAVSDYAFPGSQELADNVCDVLGDKKAALIRNHGAVGVGSDPDEALDICVLIERIAQIATFAALVGKATPLPSEIVESEVEMYRMRQEAARARCGIAE